MTKAQAVALFLAGAAAGVGGTKLSAANPAQPQIRVHALDLRAGTQLADGGYEVVRRAYATVTRPDGGVKDIGAAKSCSLGDQTALRSMMGLAVSECDWDQ